MLAQASLAICYALGDSFARLPPPHDLDAAYDEEVRRGTESDDEPQRGKFQFRLIELFVWTTAAAIVFAAVRRFGLQGLFDRLDAPMLVAGLAVFGWEFHGWIRANLGW